MRTVKPSSSVPAATLWDSGACTCKTDDECKTTGTTCQATGLCGSGRPVPVYLKTGLYGDNQMLGKETIYMAGYSIAGSFENAKRLVDRPQP
jgi:hypothetical protein